MAVWRFFFKLRGSWLALEERLYKFLFDCHLQIIWLLLNRTLYVVLITGGRLEIRNFTLKAVKVSLKLMYMGSKGRIFSRWSSVPSEQEKKTNNHPPPQIISNVLSFSCWTWGFNLQFSVLLGWNLNLQVKDTLYCLLVLLIQMKSYSRSTAIDVSFRKQNQMKICDWNYFFCNVYFTASLCMKITRPEEVPNLNEFLNFIVG